MKVQTNCSKCNIKLKILDLIPVISFLSKKSKCRYCNKKIFNRYPLIELINIFLYLLIYFKFGFTLELIGYSILCSILIIVAIIDYHYQVIPDTLNIFSLVCAIAFHTVRTANISDFIQYLIGFLIGGGFLLLIAIITHGGMGGGDIKLMAVLGLWLGWEFTIIILFLSFIIGGIISVLFILFKLKRRKDMIPFGPFIVLSTLITIFYGNNIINYYIMRFILY